MIHYESPKVYSLKNFITPVHLQATGNAALIPDCEGRSCGETHGFYCADGSVLAANGSDWIILFELTHANCTDDPDPLALGCEIVLDNSGTLTPLDCVLNSSSVILSSSCTEEGCDGQGALYEIFCTEIGNPDCETALSPGDTVTIECPAGNSVCDEAN